jgi:hypothetical protein
MDKGSVVVPPAPAAAAAKKAKRFEIKKWNAVSLWAWGAYASRHRHMALALCVFLIIYFLLNSCDLTWFRPRFLRPQTSWWTTAPSAATTSWTFVSTPPLVLPSPSICSGFVL